MTLDDYLDVRMVSTPLCLYDCDVPCRRVDRGDRVAGPTRRPTCAARRCASRRSAPRCAAARRGTSSTTSPRWRCRDAAAMMWDAHRPHAGRRRRRRALRRLQLHHAVLARGARLLRQGRGRPVRRGRPAHRPRRRRSRSTPTAASSRPAASTATASSTRRACSSGARPASARSAGNPEVGGRRRRRRPARRLPAVERRRLSRPTVAVASRV